MKEILPLCSGGSLTSLSLSLFCCKLPSWFFSLRESSFWIFVLLGQIWCDDSHFLSSLFSFFPIPSFLFFLKNINDDFSAFCYGQSNASEAVMACLLGQCYNILRNITAFYKYYIIKNDLMDIQHSKCTLSGLLLTLVQMVSTCSCSSHIHLACIL